MGGGARRQRLLKLNVKSGVDSHCAHAAGFGLRLFVLAAPGLLIVACDVTSAKVWGNIMGGVFPFLGGQSSSVQK